MEYHQWEEAVRQEGSQKEQSHHPKQVDASWISESQKADIGWVLMNHRGERIMKGSTSIDPIASPLEAETFAFRDAVLQVKRHGYRNVIFCGDSKVALDSLDKCRKEDRKERYQAIATYCEDLMKLSNMVCDFNFKAIARVANQEVDALAMDAILLNSNYVITWIPNVL